MQDIRTRSVLVVFIVALCGVSLVIFANRQSEKPVIITGAQSADANPVKQDPSMPVVAQPSTAASQDTASAATMPTASEQPAPVLALVYVHVAGAVKNPNLYKLPPGSRVADAIDAAGGAKPYADIDAINLAEKLTDGEKIYIPRKGEVPTGDTQTATVQPGNTIGHGPSSSGKSDSGDNDAEDSHSHSGHDHGHSSDKITDPSEGRININTADAEELQRLPGVGPAMAARIIAYRKENGGFKRPEDLMEVGGIGDKRMAKLAPLVVVR